MSGSIAGCAQTAAPGPTIVQRVQGEKPPPESTVAMAWCYGAPGVGLTRLYAFPHARNDEERAAFREEIEQAVRRTLQRGPGQNHCLCHGCLL